MRRVANRCVGHFDERAVAPLTLRTRVGLQRREAGRPGNDDPGRVKVDAGRKVDDAVDHPDFLHSRRAARMRYCERLMRSRSASLPSEESSNTYQTAWPLLVPRNSGKVTLPSRFSTALRTNKVRPSAWAASGVARPHRVARVAPAINVLLVFLTCALQCAPLNQRDNASQAEALCLVRVGRRECTESFTRRRAHPGGRGVAPIRTGQNAPALNRLLAWQISIDSWSRLARR